MTNDPVYMANWRAANKDRVAEWQKAYYEANRESLKDTARKRYHKNRAACLERNRRYAEENKEKIKDGRKRYWRTKRKAREAELNTSPQYRAERIVRRSRCAARHRSLEFSITVDDIISAVEAGVCQVTGISLDMRSTDGPWRPSIDRIDSSKGYVQGNVRIVVWLYNTAKHKYTDADVLRMAEALLQAQGVAS